MEVFKLHHITIYIQPITGHMCYRMFIGTFIENLLKPFMINVDDRWNIAYNFFNNRFVKKVAILRIGGQTYE